MLFIVFHVSLAGKSIDELIEAGMEKVGKMGPAAAGPATGAAAAAPVEEKKVEESEEESVGGLGGMF